MKYIYWITLYIFILWLWMKSTALRLWKLFLHRQTDSPDRSLSSPARQQRCVPGAQRQHACALCGGTLSAVGRHCRASTPVDQRKIHQHLFVVVHAL